MHHPNLPYRIFPLGDAALTIDFGNTIDEIVNEKVLALYHQLKTKPIQGMIEAVPAYSSLTIYYDPVRNFKKTKDNITAYDHVASQLHEHLQEPIPKTSTESRQISIPVCYDSPFAPDLASLAAAKNLTVPELIGIHTEREYRVYMIGFLPGFSYMGEVDERISAPRKAQPVAVRAGSVGIAGKQTGVYPFHSPGGWQIIGRTPLRFFDPASDNPSLLKAGDIVRFISISKDEFTNH
ncbi:MAG: 5-oxoprolinase subunit PxpB [Chitinophagaceae bacterium]|nr:5-oxoprolinase subunit PxpB [Chitinophagaceae bacterium]